jgi:hypothetical protein
MTMARNPTNIEDTRVEHPETPGLEPELADAQSRDLIEIDQQYGDIIPYDRNSTIQELRFYLRQTADSILEAGKRLILIKEHEPHGEFLNALDLVGIDRFAASRLMNVAVKFSNLRSNANLDRLGKSKLIELTILDTEEIGYLIDEGGTVRGLKLDDVDRMSVKELRAALRKSREEVKQVAETKDLIIQKKDQKLNQLDEQLATHEVKQRLATLIEPEQIALDARNAMQHTSEQIRASIMAGLRRELIALLDAPGDHKQLAASCILEISRELNLLRDEFNLPHVVNDQILQDPTWQAVLKDLDEKDAGSEA